MGSSSSRIFSAFSIPTPPEKLPSKEEFTAYSAARLQEVDKVEHALKEVLKTLVIVEAKVTDYSKSIKEEASVFKELTEKILLYKTQIEKAIKGFEKTKKALQKITFSDDATLMTDALAKRTSLLKGQQKEYVNLIKKTMALQFETQYLLDEFELSRRKWSALDEKKKQKQQNQGARLTSGVELCEGILYEIETTLIPILHKDAFHPLAIELNESEKKKNAEVDEVNRLIETISASLDGIEKHLRENKMASTFIINLKHAYVELILSGTIHQSDLTNVVKEIKNMIEDVQEKVPSTKQFCQTALDNLEKLHTKVSSWHLSTARFVAARVLQVSSKVAGAALQIGLPVPAGVPTGLFKEAFGSILGEGVTKSLMTSLQPRSSSVGGELKTILRNTVQTEVGTVPGSPAVVVKAAMNETPGILLGGVDKVHERLDGARQSYEEMKAPEGKSQITGKNSIEIEGDRLLHVAKLPGMEFSPELIRYHIKNKFKELLRARPKTPSPENNFKLFMLAVGVTLSATGIGTPLGVAIMATVSAAVMLGFDFTAEYQKREYEKALQKFIMTKVEGIHQGFALLEMGDFRKKITHYQEETATFLTAQLAEINAKLELSDEKPTEESRASRQKELANRFALIHLIAKLEELKKQEIFSGDFLDEKKDLELVKISTGVINAYEEIKKIENELRSLHLEASSPLDIAYTEAIASLHRANFAIDNQVAKEGGVNYHIFHRKISGLELGRKVLVAEQQVRVLEKMLPKESHMPHDITTLGPSAVIPEKKSPRPSFK